LVVIVLIQASIAGVDMSHGRSATITRISGSVYLLRKSTVATGNTKADPAARKMEGCRAFLLCLAAALEDGA